MWNPLVWYRHRGRGVKIALLAAGAFVGLGLLYVSSRSLQYAAASRTPAGIFVPDGAEIVVRVSNLSGRWSEVQETEFWKSFKRRLQKDPAIRESLNDILKASGAPSLDELEDRRWLDRNPMLQESSMRRFAGRDFVLSAIGSKFCVATRVGLSDFILLPALQIFPGAAGTTRTEAAGIPVLKRGDLFIAIQGAIVVASNDPALLGSALKRKGKAEEVPGLVRATVSAEPMVTALRGFPLGALFAIADVEATKRL